MKLSLATSFLVLVSPSIAEGAGLRQRLLAESPTLAAIKARGKLLCGSSSSLGMTWFHDDGTVDGFQVDLVSGFIYTYIIYLAPDSFICRTLLTPPALKSYSTYH